MILRKIYIKTRLFFASNLDLISKLIFLTILAVFFFIFLNHYIVGEFLIGKANKAEINEKYDHAINLYNIAYSYYKVNHYGPENQGNYYELPYQIAFCYLQKAENNKANDIMLKASQKIEKEYGVFSKENAEFSRKYLMEFYLISDNYNAANNEFNTLLNIYQKIGYNENEHADMFRIKGDLYVLESDSDNAILFYNKAYEIMLKQKFRDYRIYSKIIQKICDYEVANKDLTDAIDLYKTLIDDMKNTNERQADLIAENSIRLGDIYNSLDELRNAISCYEEATRIIKTLPKNSHLQQNFKTYLLTLRDLYNRNGQSNKVGEIDIELARQRRLSFLH